MLRNKRGFTLIEIIAVFVILGILATLAVPRFYHLQDEARTKAVAAAIAALQSQASMLYSQQLLKNEATFSQWSCPPADHQFNVGDYYGVIVCRDDTPLKDIVARIEGPPNLIDGVRDEDLQKTFDLAS